MRIALVLECGAFGGTRTYAEMLIRLLHSHGYEICVLIPEMMKEESTFINFLHQHKAAWTTYPEKNTFFRNRLLGRVFWELSRAIPWIMRYRPSMLLISHGTPERWLSMFLLPLPVFHILHTCVEQPGRLSSPVIAVLRKFLGKRKMLCTVSQFAAAQIQKYWKADASIIYNPTRYESKLATNPRIRRATRIITMGHVIAYKNPYVWLSVAQRVLAKHPDVSFTWYGEGPLFEQMRTLSRGLKGVMFAGYASEPAVCYDSADIYFHPSLVENHSIAVLEAMSFGLPCVVSTTGGLPESVEHGVTGFVVDPYAGQAMAAHLCQLIEAPQECSAMGMAGQERIRAHFLPAEWEKKTLHAMQSLHN